MNSTTDTPNPRESWTKTQLLEEIDKLQSALGLAGKTEMKLREEVRTCEGLAAEARKLEKDTRLLFNDLKVKLAAALAENSRLYGYLQRVQEDDQVREDLIPTGDPDGHCVMKPKRKHAPVFPIDEHFRERAEAHYRETMGYSGVEARPRPRHYIEY